MPEGAARKSRSKKSPSGVSRRSRFKMNGGTRGGRAPKRVWAWGPRHHHAGLKVCFGKLALRFKPISRGSTSYTLIRCRRDKDRCVRPWAFQKQALAGPKPLGEYQSLWKEAPEFLFFLFDSRQKSRPFWAHSRHASGSAFFADYRFVS